MALNQFEATHCDSGSSARAADHFVFSSRAEPQSASEVGLIDTVQREIFCEITKLIKELARQPCILQKHLNKKDDIVHFCATMLSYC